MEKRVPRPPPRADGGRRRRVPDRRERRRRRRRSTSCAREFDAIVLAGGVDAAARSAGAGPRARGHPLRDGVPDAAEPALRRRRDRRRASSSRAEGQARHHHRRRRHRRRLPRHGAPPGRAQRCTSSSCCRGRRTTRAASNPWPLWPNIFRVSSAHEEGGERLYSISTERFSGDDDGRVTTLHARHGRDGAARTAGIEFEPVPGSEFELKADLVLLAMGFVGPGDATACSTSSA